MATMYVYNIPTNETVNLRATPNGTILVRVPYGAAVEASPSATSGWHNASYNNYSGYIMSQYLTYTNPSGGGGGGTYLGTGTVIGGGPLYCRKQPIAGYAYWGQFQEGTTVQIYSCSTSGWYETRWPANGTNIGYVMSQYISLSGGGGTGSLQTGHYVCVKQSAGTVNVRASTSTSSDRLGVLRKGTKLYCAEVVSSTWVKVRWGGKTQTYAYIMSQFLEDGGIAASSLKQRAIDIAESMADQGYPDTPEECLDIGHGAWCVRYVSFLLKAAGCSSGNYVPFTDALVSEAVAFFENKGTFGLKANKAPAKGDWVFFSQGSETYQHVGFVVDVSGTSITTVEGNLNGTITSRGPTSYYGSFGNMTVYGFGTPSWS
mgnify:CR=1 FL=1